MAALAGRHPVVDERDRIGAARILRQPVVVEIESPGLRIEHHVLEHSAESPCRRIDLRFRLGRQANHLRVAAALEIEDAPPAPAMLVVTDQAAFRIAGQSRLPGPRQAEEQRRVALGTDIGRAVHRQYPAERQQVVHDREDRLLDLARIAGAADQDEPFGEVEQDEHRRVGAVLGRVRLHGRHVDDRETGGVLGIGLARRTGEKHRAREQAVPCALGDDPNRQAIFRIRPGEAVLNEQFPAAQRRQHPLLDRLEPVRSNVPVDLSPPDVRCGRWLADEKLVERRPPGMHAGEADERAALRHLAFRAPDRVLVQRRGAWIPMNLTRINDAVSGEIRHC